MTLLGSVFAIPAVIIKTTLDIAKIPFEMLGITQTTTINVKIGLIQVGECVASRCIHALRVAHIGAPPIPGVVLKVELAAKDILTRFPVTSDDMQKVAAKLRKQIVTEVKSWLICTDVIVNDDMVTMLFEPREQPLRQSA